MDNTNPNKETSASQNARILEALQSGARITPLDALQRFGCLRLSARIADLREKGFRIVKTWSTENGKRFAEDRLEG